MKVVAFEGRWVPSDVVTRAAAAISDGSRLINPATGIAMPIGELDRLVSTGHLTKLSRPIDVRNEYINSPLVVLVLQRRHPLAKYIALDSGHGDMLATNRAASLHEYLFRDWDSFDTYAHGRVSEMIEAALDQFLETDKDIDLEELTTLGLILSNSHPQLNALRAFLLRDRPFAKEIALDNVRSEGLDEFERFYSGLMRVQQNPHYRLKYEHGIALLQQCEARYRERKRAERVAQ